MQNNARGFNILVKFFSIFSPGGGTYVKSHETSEGLDFLLVEFPYTACCISDQNRTRQKKNMCLQKQKKERSCYAKKQDWIDEKAQRVLGGK